MPTYVLEGAGRAVFPRRPLVVSVTVTGPAGTAEMHALVGGISDARAVRPTAGLMVLPRIDALTILRITPSGAGGVFADGTALHVSLSVEDRSDPDPDRAVIGPIDVSGESHVDVASIDSAVDGIAIAALRSKPDDDLGKLGNRARSVSRVILGVDQLPEGSQVELTVAVDGSASMIQPMTTGAISAICSVIAGISTVVSPQATPRVCLIGSTVRWIDPSSLASLGEDVSFEFGQSMLVSGFRSAIVPTPISSRAVTVVVTDGVPADLGASQSVGAVTHILAIVSDSDAASLSSRSDTTAVPLPPEGTSANEHFAGSRDTVDALVRSILERAVLAGHANSEVVAR